MNPAECCDKINWKKKKKTIQDVMVSGQCLSVKIKRTVNLIHMDILQLQKIVSLRLISTKLSIA